MSIERRAWLRADLAKVFVEDVRGGIPLAAEQIGVLLRVVRHALVKVGQILDLGCGDGILGRAAMAEYPAATAVFVDFSSPMLEAAKRQVDLRRASFILEDLATVTWTRAVASHRPFDLVLSGFAIHHLPDERKRALYREIFELLAPGGMFLNLEHVSPRAPWAVEAFDELFIDALDAHQRERGGTRTREEVATQWYYRADKSENILATVESQCQWLGEIGFCDVDCFFKLLQLALFGGRKPA